MYVVDCVELYTNNFGEGGITKLQLRVRELKKSSVIFSIPDNKLPLRLTN
jgi:hypothetical protein